MFGRVFRGCTKKKQPEVIVFDEWWSIDYLKNACDPQIAAGHQCARPANEILSDVENTLYVAFTTEPSCHDVRLLNFTSDMAEAAAKRPNDPAAGDMKEAAKEHWSLMVDIPGDNYMEGNWTMVKGGAVLTGDLGNAATAIRHICAIAKGTGGSMSSVQ